MDTNQRGGSTKVELDLERIAPEELLRVQRLARELRLTDQILSIDLDSISVVQSGPAPAWTTLEGDKVSFAMNQMPKPNTAVDVAVWLGTNAHELGHVLYSPRRESTLMYRVIESDKTYLPGIAMMHNILEDQRQERLVLARFAPWRSYLTAALGHHLQLDDDAWLLMAGRTWLPQEVRDAAKAAMVRKHGQRVTDEVTRIVGEYQRLTDPGDVDGDEAWDLLNELHTMFADDMPKMSTTCTVMTGGEPDTAEPGEGAPATADEAERGESSASDDASSSDESTSGDRDGDGDGGDTDDGDDDGKDGDTIGGGTGAGKGSTPPQPMSPAEVKKALKEAAKQQIENDEETTDDIESILDALDYGRGQDTAEGKDSPGEYLPASDVALRLRSEVSDALLDLKDESEPGWLKRTDSGRLNVRRLLSPTTSADELFDRYEPGMMDASELEVILLLDVSSSMHSETYALAEATWAIRMAVDDLEGRCTVYTWDSGPHHVMHDASARPDGRMFRPNSMGGTDPRSVLVEAYRVIAGSDARNRLVVILTDGGWSNEQRAERVIDAMNEAGVTTVFAELGGYTPPGGTTNGHHCQYAANIDDLSELARLFKRVAAEKIAAWR